MAQARGLRIRQHERREIELPVEFVVCDEHRSQVRFSSVSSAGDDGALRGTSIDISPGGLALASRQFVPRRCEGVIRLFDPTPVGTRGDGTPILQIVFEQPAKVRQIRMLSREPTYFVGVSFADPDTIDPDIGNRISMVLLKRRPEAGGSSPGSGGSDA